MRYISSYPVMVVFCLVLGAPAPALAQDNELWTSIGIDMMLASRFNLEIEQQLRLKEQISTFKKTFTEISLEYRVKKYFRVSGNYRYIISPEERSNRISLSGAFKFDLDRFSVGYRLKIQRETKQGETPEDDLRNRLGLGYQLSSGLSSYLELEMSHQADEGEYDYYKYRVTCGFKKKLTQDHSLKTFIRYQAEVNIADPSRLLIWGARYQISL